MAQFFNSRCLFRHLLFHFNLFEVQCKGGGGFERRTSVPCNFFVKNLHQKKLYTTVGFELRPSE